MGHGTGVSVVFETSLSFQCTTSKLRGVGNAFQVRIQSCVSGIVRSVSGGYLGQERKEITLELEKVNAYRTIILE